MLPATDEPLASLSAQPNPPGCEALGPVWEAAAIFAYVLRPLFGLSSIDF